MENVNTQATQLAIEYNFANSKVDELWELLSFLENDTLPVPGLKFHLTFGNTGMCDLPIWDVNVVHSILMEMIRYYKTEALRIGRKIQALKSTNQTG